MSFPHHPSHLFLVALSWLCSWSLSYGELRVCNVDPSKRPEVILSKVPVINITRPNGEGISHNKFEEYTVGREGIIYNNNSDPVHDADSHLPSQAPVAVNPNLEGQAARIILTEVSGT